MGDVNIRNRSFWILLDKFICLAPDTAKADDLVVVLLGGRLLYILRPITEGKDLKKYVFIGTAYVWGFMEGWAVQCNEKWKEVISLFSIV